MQRAVLYARKDLDNYTNSQIDCMAEYLDIGNVADKRMAIALRLHGKNAAQMSPALTPIDTWMAQFSWVSNQAKKSLNNTQIKKIEKLLEEYRIFIQGGEKNPEAMQRKIDNYIADASSEPTSVAVPDSVASALRPRLTANFPGFSKKAVLTSDDKKAIRKQVRKGYEEMPEGAAKKNARKELLGDSEAHFNPQSLGEIYRIMQLEQQQYLSALGEKLVGLQNASNAAGSSQGDIINHRLIKVEQVTFEMAKQMKDLHDAQIQNQGLTEVPWYNLPKKFKLAFSSGFKSAILFAATAPITFPAAIVNNIVIKPMYEAYEFFSRWIRIAWGVVCWVVVIAGVAHIYYTTDWTMVNEFLESSVASGAYEYTTIVIKKGWEYAPSGGELTDAMVRLWGDLSKTILAGLLENIESMKSVLYAAAIAALCGLVIVIAEYMNLGWLARSYCTGDIMEAETEVPEPEPSGWLSGWF